MGKMNQAGIKKPSRRFDERVLTYINSEKDEPFAFPKKYERLDDPGLRDPIRHYGIGPRPGHYCGYGRGPQAKGGRCQTSKAASRPWLKVTAPPIARRMALPH